MPAEWEPHDATWLAWPHEESDWPGKFESIPWVYGGCLGAEGQTFTIVPGESPCLRCVLGDVPPPGTTPTCDSAGVLAPIVNVIASWQACEILKLASGNRAAVSKTLTIIDLWENTVRQIQLLQRP